MAGAADYLFLVPLTSPPPLAVTSIADLRRDYAHATLNEADVAPDPVDQFRTWFHQALNAEVLEPNAMALATATPDGAPSARVVLLKGVDERGFVFYTDFRSRKGQELAENPRAALVFHITHFNAADESFKVKYT